MALLLGIWIVSPRFGIAAPSIVDDWSAIDNAPKALSGLLRLDYQPEEANDPHRYRPGYMAVWNSLQWRTLGAPGNLTGPNVWNLLRLALFVGALALLPVALARSNGRRAKGPGWLALIALAPPAMILATPKIGEDFARFGPVEPLLVACMMLGATLLVFATGRIVSVAGHAFERHVRWLALALAGYALWLLGVYQKEVSICFLAVAPFLYLFLNRRWKEAGLIDRPLITYWAFQALALAMLLPVLHVAIEILRLAGEGTTVYGATIPKGTEGLLTRLRSGADLQWDQMTFLLGTSFWKGVAVAVPLLLLWVAFQQRRMPWLPLGLLAGGWAAFAFQGLSGTATARYYIPSMALFGVAGAVLLARSGVWPRLAGIAVAIVFVAGNAANSNDTVETWADGDKDGNRAVGMVAALNPERCPVYMSGFEEEVADAFPELVALRRPYPSGACGGRHEAFLVGRQHPERITPVTNEAILKACSGRGWTDYEQTEVWRIRACRRLKTGRIEGQPVRTILGQDRLVPGERYSERREQLAAQ